MKALISICFYTVLTLTFSNSAMSKNCDLGKQCGDACISKNKVCRLGTKAYHNPSFSPPKLTSTYSHTKNKSSVGIYSPTPSEQAARSPSTDLHYIVIVNTVMAQKSPTSEKITGSYRKGQEVVAYQLHNSWARVNNSYPNQWIELKYLTPK